MRDSTNGRISVTLICALIGAGIACSNRPSDETIVKDIQKKIAADPETKDAPVTVAAKAGNVTLSGKVQAPAVQQRLEQLARQEPGTAKVDDLTTVEAPPPAPQVATAPESQTPAAPAATAPEPANAAPAIAAAPAPAAPPEEAPKPQPIIVRAGTALTVRTTDALSSKSSQAGQTFLATLAQPVSVGRITAIPVGATLSGTVVSAKAKGKIKGEGQLALALTSVSIRGRTYRIHTNVLDSTIKGKGKRTAVTSGGGAGAGALIGGLAGGGKGAGIGALAGAGAGFIGGVFSGNKQIEIPPESVLSFTLAQSLRLPPRTP